MLTQQMVKDLVRPSLVVEENRGDTRQNIADADHREAAGLFGQGHFSFGWSHLCESTCEENNAIEDVRFQVLQKQNSRVVLTSGFSHISKAEHQNVDIFLGGHPMDSLEKLGLISRRLGPVQEYTDARPSA